MRGRRRSRLCGWVALVLSTGSIQAQDEPILKAHQYAVIIQGCVKGKRIERPVIQSAPESLPIDARHAAGFVFEGDKQLLKSIENEHKNHTDEVIGIVTVPPSLARTLSRRVGGINIGIGTPGSNRMMDAPQVFKLRVTSIVHVQSRCA